MVVTVEARKFSLPSLSLSSPHPTSLLYHPNSSSLALMHSDSTISLFPSFSPFSSTSLSPSQTLIPSPSSSACFVPLHRNPNPRISIQDDGQKRVVFVTAGPHNGGSRVCLRFYVMGVDGKFEGATQVGCTQNGIWFERRVGVVVDVSHGMKVFLSGSVNYLALYSPSGGKVLVFGVKMVGDDDGRKLRLVKCAVIECRLPVSSICVSFGFLILGEVGGVRVFPLRVLVKGRGVNRRRVRLVRGKGENSNAEEREGNVQAEGRNLKLLNGDVRGFDEGHELLDKNFENSSLSKLLPNGHAYGVLDGVTSSSNANGTVKLRSLKFWQDSGEWGMQFVLFNDCVHEGIESRGMQFKKTKAVSIQAVSQEKFLVLDSNGDLHILHVSKSGSSVMRQLTCAIQVQLLAAFPDASADSQIFWVSDGLYSVHVMVIPGSDAIEKENGDGNNEEIIQSSVTQAIFTSENILDMVPLAANRVLILGQDSVYAYGIS